MLVIKVTSRGAISQPEFLVVDSYEQAEELHKKHYPGIDIISMELISDQVINAWAQ
jgi:hypothetical protein